MDDGVTPQVEVEASWPTDVEVRTKGQKGELKAVARSSVRR